MHALPDIEDIRRAREVIQPHAHRTPVLSSRHLDERTGAEVYLKCENFQKVGAFKFRGACNTIMTLPEEQARRGVTTHSSGNHAQAIALAARLRDIPATIVMPENAPRVKVNAVRGYGAEIRFCKATQQAREATAQAVVDETGATFIHPYNDGRIIAGQGTAVLELLEQQPRLDLVLAPVGGGGLISGTGIAAKSIRPEITVIAAEPEKADDACRSFKAGRLIPLEHTDTIADGLRTSLGDLTFSAITKYVDDIVTVSEQQIVEAMRFVWERMKIIIEPSSAVPVAALMNSELGREKRVGVIISGGNVDLDQLPWQDL